MPFRIGIDIGGTFTDLVAVDDTGAILHAKTPSTPADQSIGVMEGLAQLAAAAGLSLTDVLARTERIVHGTTVATNALLERKGARVGLLATEGHRDVLEMREGLKEDRYNLRLPPPEPLVPRNLRLGVAERIRHDGRVAAALDAASLAAAIGALKAAGVEAVAVCYLHSYRDPTHERMTAAALRALMPNAYVSLSSEVLPQIKEYERTCTTVVNAYVGPALERYLRRLAERLAEGGFAGPLLVIQSHGGVATVDHAVRLAAGAVLSGPAGGVAGAVQIARVIGQGDLIAFDMGGTRTDISLIVGGEAAISSGRTLAGQRVGLQSLDIATIGAGGGSIAYVDAAGLLRVGPASAGAEPGPACYGRGGTRATMTDASVVLGLIGEAGLLGGAARLDRAAAEAAVDQIAAGLSINRIAAASGIHRVVNAHMAERVRLVSVRRGIDPRRFALLSFGGAAGLHVTEVARQLEIRRVIAPRLASVLSAWGMLASDLRWELARTQTGDAKALGPEGLRRIYAELETEGRARLEEARFAGPVRIRRFADMRYGEQVFEIPVDLSGIDWSGDELIAAVAEAVHGWHEALYTYALREEEVVLVNARVSAIGCLPALPSEPPRQAAAPRPPTGLRTAWLGSWRELPVYRFKALAAGQRIAGPALVESDTTTVLLRDGDDAAVTPLGWLDVAVPA